MASVENHRTMASAPVQLAELLTKAAEVKELFAEHGSSSRLLRSYQWLLVSAGKVSGDPVLLADLRRQLVSCLACLRTHGQRLALKPLKLEAIWLETGSICEQHNDLRLALEVLLGLVRHLAKRDRSQPDAEAADSLQAHTCLRAAGITRRLGQLAVCSDILELCQNIRTCCSLRPRCPQVPNKSTTVPSSPSPQKLLEWLLHLVGSLPPQCSAKMASDCWNQALAALQEHSDLGTEVYLKAAGILRSQVVLGKEAKAVLFRELANCCPQEHVQTGHQPAGDWVAVIEEAALAGAEFSEERMHSTEAGGLHVNKNECIYQSTKSACLEMLRAYHCLQNPSLPPNEQADSVAQASEELKTFLASTASGRALQRLLRAAELLRRCSARQMPGRQEKGRPAEALLLRLGELFVACINVAERCEPIRAISACASPLRPRSSAGREGDDSRQHRLLFLTGACELLCVAARADTSAVELLSACLARTKGPTEQATLIQLVGSHLRKASSNIASTRAIAKSLCMALGAAARRKTLLRDTREESVLLRAMVAAVDPVVARLWHGIALECLDESNVDWPSSILRQLSASASGHVSFPAGLHSLIMHLVQAKHVMLDSWLRSQQELKGFKASSVFRAARERLVTQFTTIVQGRDANCDSASLDLPKVQGPAPLCVLFRIGGLCCSWEVETAQNLNFWIAVLKAIDQLKMKLAPCSPASAVFSLCQLDIIYHLFPKFDVLDSNVASLVDSFARLVLSLCQSGEVMTALGAQGDFKDHRPLPLRAALCQLEKASAAVEDPLLLGRLRLLQAHCSLQICSLEGVDEGEDPEPFAQGVLPAWRQHFGLHAFANVAARRPAQVASALSEISAAASPGKATRKGPSRLSPALLRELLEAVHLFELLDMHTLAAEVLAISLACVTAGTCARPDWWMFHRDELAPSNQPARSTMQATVILLYRLVGAVSRTASGVAADWWQVAESAHALLSGSDHDLLPGFAADLEAQRLGALTSLPFAIVTVQVRETMSAILATASKVLEQSSQEVEGHQFVQHGFITAEVLWGLAEWSMNWSDSRADQRPGGSGLTAQCAALRSLTLLLAGSKPAPAKQVPKQQSTKHAEEGVLHWPMLRSFLLQLRVIHQTGLLYERLGEPRLADLCFQGGLQLMARKLCGDRRWKLRFLCGRARLAVAGFPSPAILGGPSVQAAPPLASRSLEDMLEEVKCLWNQKFHGQPRLICTSEEDSLPQSLSNGSDRTSTPNDLLDLWLSLSLRKGGVGSTAFQELMSWLTERARPGDLRSANALLQLLSKNAGACDERWVEVAVLLVRAASGSMVPHFLARGLLAAAEGAFSALQSAATAPQRLTMRAALQLCISALDRRNFIANEAERICAALKSLLSGQAALWLEASLLLAAAALHCGLQVGDALTTRNAAQMLTKLAHWTLKPSIQEAPTREPQAAMHLAVSTVAKLRKGKTWCVPRAAASAATLDSLEGAGLHPEERSRSPCKHRQAHSDADLRNEVWELCKRVVPVISGVSMLFLQELRSIQRIVESLSDSQTITKLLHLPKLNCKVDLQDEALAMRSDGAPALSSDSICDGSWLSEMPSGVSVAWLQADSAGQALQITRSCSPGHNAVISQRVELKPGLLQSLQEEFRVTLSSHGSKCREISKRSAVDKKSEASKLEFWQNCKRFDDQLGCLARRIQQEMLGGWRCLLAPWPQCADAQKKLVSSVEAWLDDEAAKPAFTEFGIPRRPANMELGSGRRQQSGSINSCCSLSPRSCCCASRFWLLVLLFQEADTLDPSEIAAVLASGVLSNSPSSLQLHRLASSLKRHRQEAAAKVAASIPTEAETPLLLFVDSVTAQLPLEACPCLQVPLPAEPAACAGPGAKRGPLCSGALQNGKTLEWFLCD
eukprot:TRINITY_DN4571_c0_g1_i1.p1 TRINITY_DN4571_c0_g1~~TRINITY_DN4571_c0_g1_i1.p1  ORF type:complete len:1891 (+),score=319.79 TRINITY_DN4571_c0_g1_i1:166-5838(+)